MLKGLFKLTWLELKIFLREPLGVIGSILVPVAVFLVLGRIGQGAAQAPAVVGPDLPTMAALFISLSAALSLVAILAIYREGGILKRLRATPLRPYTILSAHVLVKLLTTLATVAALLLAGKRYFPVGVDIPYVPFALAVLISTLSVLSIGFIVASVVPTARFAQPVGTLLFYPMIVLSGLFFPVAVLPGYAQALSRLLPVSYAVSLMRGIWRGEGWMAHAGDLAALAVVFLICVTLSARVFRWE
jgi:ABC-2 type transport system permease protein